MQAESNSHENPTAVCHLPGLINTAQNGALRAGLCRAADDRQSTPLSKELI